ncbi:phosphotransferase family protein [Paenibacillus apiarius]|uniref:phosphotransferase family protein n=1 Tax=Paenibacillus apiarius TaxID=46240 RepID=UPI001981F281|nr:phosphotransferase family protein [Paenibacillus apiarius]MBN3524862.1 phosphotransferase family protein [Paenibacillus apiarius]
MSKQEALPKDTIPVRKGEELNFAALETYLREHLDIPPGGSMAVEQFGAGHSNLTYQICMGEWQAVVRRPPFGPVAPKAHDMEREYTILDRLHPFFSLAPRPYLYCEDISVIGSPFFVMERRHGVILDQSFPPHVKYTPELGRKISEAMVATLVQLHEVPYQETNLTAISQPDGFMRRQVHGWVERYERAKTEEIPEAEQLKKWLIDSLPASQSPTVIHYDYKLNNVMFSGSNMSEMTGVFDWEMATVGDPMADVGAALSYWFEQDDPPELLRGLGHLPLTIQPGFMSRDEFLEAYAARSGRDVSDVHYYLTFAYFKLAVICQQIYYRWKKGQTKDGRFARFNETVQALVAHALRQTERRER